MAIQNENAKVKEQEKTEIDMNLDDLERTLQENLENEFSDAEFIDEQILEIGNPESLGTVVYETIWEQVRNQIGVQAGEDFVKANHGQKLDLRNSAHIQTTENFAKGKIATHNHDIDYKKRYDDWQGNFQKDPNSKNNPANNERYNEKKEVWEKQDNRSKEWKPELNKDARADFDKDRPQGNKSKNTAMDHTVSAAEIIRDPEAAAHLSRDEQIEFANSEKNLNEMDAAANSSKSDSKMDEWLDSERDGEKPTDRFPIDEDELRKKDKEAREEYEKTKKEGEKRSEESGRKSQKDEAKRIGKKAGRAIVMNLLTDLVKTIVRKFIGWLASKGKSLKTLLTSLKDAILDFIKDFKQKLINTADSAATVIATSILGPVIGTIKKAWMFLKQGYKSVKDAIKYLKDPDNKNKPISYKMLEVGKIVMGGITVAGALVLGEVIEKGLMTIPIFAFEIPFLGSLANIIGIFLGAIVAGLIGALAINLINRMIAKKMKRDLVVDQVEKLNHVLETQEKLLNVKEVKLNQKKDDVANLIKRRHQEAGELISDSVNHILENSKDDGETDEKIRELNEALDSLI